MQVLTFDEVDHAQLPLLHFHCFGAPLGASRVQGARQLDARCVDEVALYAVEQGRLLGQVMLLQLDLELPQGRTTVGGIAAVCTRPDADRRGVASTLMARAHQVLQSHGMELVLLNTWRSWVAHDLYDKLGYRTVLQLPVASRDTTAGPLVSDDDLSVQEGPTDPWGTLYWLYRQHAEDALGFVHRHKDFYAAKEAWGMLAAAQAYVVHSRADGAAVGYAVVAHPAGGPVLREVVAQPGRLPAVLGALEQHLDSPTLIGQQVCHRGNAAQFEAAGWQLDPGSWIVLMALDLRTPWREAADLQQRLGTDTDRFLYGGLDLF